MIIFFSFAGSDIGKRPQNPGLRQEFVNNAELILLQACVHVSVFGFPHIKSIDINIKYG